MDRDAPAGLVGARSEDLESEELVVAAHERRAR
jgi:hypothetical protein